MLIQDYRAGLTLQRQSEGLTLRSMIHSSVDKHIWDRGVPAFHSCNARCRIARSEGVFQRLERSFAYDQQCSKDCPSECSQLRDALEIIIRRVTASFNQEN
jgi:hypothetical protein